MSAPQPRAVSLAELPALTDPEALPVEVRAALCMMVRWCAVDDLERFRSLAVAVLEAEIAPELVAVDPGEAGAEVSP